MTGQKLKPAPADDLPVTGKWFSRLAVLTVIMTLWPVIFGAHTTTRGAGMAFPDWPSSDGINMLLYPWFSAVGDKFLEHSHRLGGICIGVLSILLVFAAWKQDRRRWVLVLTLVVLAGILAQGAMGGTRVIKNSIPWAIFHGAFAPLVTSLIAVVALVAGRGWQTITDKAASIPLGKNKTFAYTVVVCLFLQYILGCFLRHKGTAVHEHLGFAAISTIAIIVMKIAALRSGSRWLKSSAGLVATMLLVQLLLGLGAWVTRFGLPAVFDYVPVVESGEQNLMRTAHTVTGMMLFVSAVVHAVKVKRIDWLQKQELSAPAGSPGVMPSSTKESTT